MGHPSVSRHPLLDVTTLKNSGQSELEEHIAIRPTSETVMYPCKLDSIG